MDIVTFYSYKGGTGRSLALANTAQVLARFGCKVFVIDMDLEAPGLHYKLGSDERPLPVKFGFLDYLSASASGETPLPISDYVVEAHTTSLTGGSIHLMAAGNAPSPTYIEILSLSVWRDFIRNQRGRAAVGQLLQDVQAAFNPDFVLIDARTGFTDLGWVAAGIFAEHLVCFISNNAESREGSRAALRVLQARRNESPFPLNIIPVLTRIPLDAAGEADVRAHLKAFLEQPEGDGEKLDCGEVLVLHSDPSLEKREHSKVGHSVEFRDDQLSRDYVSLFVRLLPRKFMAAKAVTITGPLERKFLSNPSQVISDLRNLARLFPDRSTIEPLMRALNGRGRFWEVLTEAVPIADEMATHALVREALSNAVQNGVAPSGDIIDFAFRVWQASPEPDATVGSMIARQYALQGNHQMAADVVAELRHAEPRELLRILPSIIPSDQHAVWEKVFLAVVEGLALDPSLSSEFADYTMTAATQHPYILRFLQSRPEDQRPKLAYQTANELAVGSLARSTGVDGALQTLVPRLWHSDQKAFRELGRTFNTLDMAQKLESIIHSTLPELEAHAALSVLRRMEVRSSSGVR